MTPELSPNAKAILLLTAPLIAGQGKPSTDLLSPGEYKRIARRLRDLQRQPADLVSTDAAELVHACRPVIDEGRLARLLARGFLLSHAVERWRSRAIWVISRADPGYPRRLKVRLKEDAPAVLYGCGDISLLDTGGLAVVGSRHVDDTLVDYTMAVGRLAARASRTLVSGGAKGIDQAAMRGALEAGGRVSGVLADSLEKTAMNREHRNPLLGGQLVLVSPYDPSAGFNVGNAMQRNKLIYALADAALVVSSDLNKGGTWAGAIEQIDKLKLVPVFFRSSGARSDGLDALRAKGAIPWPNPEDAPALDAVFDVEVPNGTDELRTGFPLFPSGGGPSDAKIPPPATDVAPPSEAPSETPPLAAREPEAAFGNSPAAPEAPRVPAEVLFATVREVIQGLLTSPLKDAEVATMLNVSTAQAKVWLQRLIDEGVVEKQKEPAGYIRKQKRLFE